MSLWNTGDLISADRMNEFGFFRESISNGLNLNNLAYNTLLQKASSQTTIYSLSGTNTPNSNNNDFPCLNKNASIIHFQTGNQTACQLILGADDNNFIRRKTSNNSGWTEWSQLATIPVIKIDNYKDFNKTIDVNSLRFLNSAGIYPNTPFYCRDTGFIKTFTSSDNIYYYGTQLAYSTAIQNKAYIRGFRKKKADNDNTFKDVDWVCLNSYYTSINPTSAAAIKKNIWCCSQPWTSVKEGKTTFGKELTKKNVGIPFIDYTSKAQEWYNSHGETWPDINELFWGRLCNDMTIKSLPYSSVIGQDGDILYSRTLATFYSAVLNPYSILYTGAIEEPTKHNNVSRASRYGVVCSSYGSALAGSKLYFSSKNLFTLIKNQIVNNRLTLTVPKTPSDLSIGMLRVGTEHIQIISNILYDDQGEALIEIAEARKPFTITITEPFSKIKDDFKLALKTYNDTKPQGYFCINLSDLKDSNNNTLIQTESFITLDDYAIDVITEYGNNTWFITHTDSESNFHIQDIKLYSPLTNVENLYLKNINDLDWTIFVLSDDDKIALSNGNYIISHNKSNDQKIDSYGTWYVTTDKTANNPAIINVVDFGEGYVSYTNTPGYYTFYVNNFENLIPIGFKVLKYKKNNNDDKVNAIKKTNDVTDGTTYICNFSKDNKQLIYDYSEDSFGYFVHNNAPGDTISSKQYKLSCDSVLVNSSGKGKLMFEIPTSNLGSDWCIRVYFEVREIPSAPRYGMSFLEIYPDNIDSNRATRTKNYITLEDIS